MPTERIWSVLPNALEIRVGDISDQQRKDPSFKMKISEETSKPLLPENVPALINSQAQSVPVLDHNGTSYHDNLHCAFPIIPFSLVQTMERSRMLTGCWNRRRRN